VRLSERRKILKGIGCWIGICLTATRQRPTHPLFQAGHLCRRRHLHCDGVVTTDTEHGRKAIRFTPVLQSGNETLMHYACLDGMGFAFLPKWLVSEDLAAGRLKRVLTEKLFFAGRLLAVYPSRKYLSVLKVRSFLDFIARDPRLR
jgi:DNA-binding transcriptional LysR family regulator